MKTTPDIENIEDIKLFVNQFYQKIKNDALLAPIFFEKIPNDWQPHLDKMYLFWNAALFGVKGYVGNPFAKHNSMQISLDHFSIWLYLFKETINEHFSGPIAENAKWRAQIMATTFLKKLAFNVENKVKTIL